MRKYFFAITSLVFALSFIFAHAAGSISFSSLAPRQGETAIITIASLAATPITATLNNKTFPVFPYRSNFRAIIPISATQAPGTYDVAIAFSDKTSTLQTLTIRKQKFPIIILPVPEKLALTPQAVTQKLGAQNTDIRSIVQEESKNIFFAEPFGLPLVDNRRIVSVFGEIRKTPAAKLPAGQASSGQAHSTSSGQASAEEIRHLGTDFGAKTGAAVGAINSGVVTKAYLDPIYGKTVILNHGQGVYSLYMHLDSIAVLNGAQLRKGALIGRVGQTGLASGPHLHLSIKISGISIDPVQFIRNFK